MFTDGENKKNRYLLEEEMIETIVELHLKQLPFVAEATTTMHYEKDINGLGGIIVGIDFKDSLTYETISQIIKKEDL